MNPRDWPVYRQLAGTARRGLGAAAKSTHPREARTSTADHVVKSICPYCAVGCAQNVYVKDAKVIQIEGDPDSPVSRGRLCPKGSASLQLTAGGSRQPVTAVAGAAEGVRWLMASDVCKHCTESGCLDVCPTGALFRTEFGTVVVQDDVCNGCGYCVGACPFGVIARREEDGQAHKCTLCYDRLGAGMEPAWPARRCWPPRR